MKERMALYSRVQRILAKELPYVSLWHEIRLTAYKSRVRGFSPMPGGDFTPLKDIWLATR
jgi:ABC-type transport system substrate-binding protein